MTCVVLWAGRLQASRRSCSNNNSQCKDLSINQPPPLHPKWSVHNRRWYAPSQLPLKEVFHLFPPDLIRMAHVVDDGIIRNQVVGGTNQAPIRRRTLLRTLPRLHRAMRARFHYRHTILTLKPHRSGL